MKNIILKVKERGEGDILISKGSKQKAVSMVN